MYYDNIDVTINVKRIFFVVAVGGFVCFIVQRSIIQLKRQRNNRNKYPNNIPILLYVPNILGYIRIILSFIGLYYSIIQQPVVAVGVWIVACSLDLIDGIVARYLHQTSKFGILLDIIADNILRTIIWIATSNSASLFYYYYHHPSHRETTSTLLYPESQLPYNNNSNNNNNNDDATGNSCHSIVSSQYSAIIIIIISGFIICMEWLTMISTQLYAASASKRDEGTHWKQQQQQHVQDEEQPAPPKIIQYFFSNNFRNPMGCIGIYGLFACNLFLYGCYHPILYRAIPYYTVWMYLAFIGRSVSLYIECFFCTKFISFILRSEGTTRSRNTNHAKRVL